MDGCGEACIPRESGPFRGKGHSLRWICAVSTGSRYGMVWCGVVWCGVAHVLIFNAFALLCYAMLCSAAAHYMTSFCPALSPIYLLFTAWFISHHIILHHIISYDITSFNPILRSLHPQLEYKIDQADAGYLTPLWPALQGSLYESQFQSQLHMVRYDMI